MPSGDEGSDGEKQLPLLQKWADGQATLKDVRGYSDEEIYTIARTAYVYYYQGRIAEARTLFQGLYAVNPLDGYVAKALGVVEFAAGNGPGALAAYDVALRLDPEDAAAFVGRAEVRLALNRRSEALADLRRANELASADSDLKEKIGALLTHFLK